MQTGLSQRQYPVNYLNFVSPHAAKYEHSYYCTAFIGNFINDHVVSDGTCLEGLCKHLKNMREREGGRERERESEREKSKGEETFF